MKFIYPLVLSISLISSNVFADVEASSINKIGTQRVCGKITQISREHKAVVLDNKLLAYSSLVSRLAQYVKDNNLKDNDRVCIKGDIFLAPSVNTSSELISLEDKFFGIKENKYVYVMYDVITD